MTAMIPPVLTLLVAGAAPLWGSGPRLPEGLRLALQAAPETNLAVVADAATDAAEAPVSLPAPRPGVSSDTAPFAFPGNSPPPSYDWRSRIIFDVP